MKDCKLTSAIAMIITLVAVPADRATAAALEDQVSAMRELVSRYDSRIRAHTGQSVRFSVVKSSAIQLTGGHDSSGNVSVKIWQGAIDAMTLEGLYIATCHEIGHILGTVTRRDAGAMNFPAILDDGVEGEADYFAGSCFRENYSSDVSVFRDSINRLFFTVYKRNPAPENAKDKIYPGGIQPSYPDADCRALSMLHGFEGRKRPRCWYNP